MKDSCKLIYNVGDLVADPICTSEGKINLGIITKVIKFPYSVSYTIHWLHEIYHERKLWDHYEISFICSASER